MFRFYWTIKYLSSKQILFRIIKKLRRIYAASNSKFYKKNKIYFKSNGFKNYSFLNIFDKRIDYNNQRFLNKLELYNLNYFNFIFFLNFNSSKKKILKWIEKNSNFFEISWDPYPTSLRIINFIKWCNENNCYDQTILNSIVQQTKFLEKNLEYDLMTNHYFSNLKALYFAHNFLPNIFDTRKKKNIEISLFKEIKKQILNDGGHIEQSSMYHNIFLYDLLDILQLNKINKKKTKFLKSKIISMIRWSEIMLHKDLSTPYFNDTCDGISPDINFLKKYFKKLYKENLIKISKKEYSISLKSSGFFVYQNNNYKIIIRTGGISCDYNPAHQHADLLSFEISDKKKKIITNSGLSTYESSIERLNQKSSNFKNTVTFNNQNNLDVWKSFRVGYRPKINSKLQKKNNLNLNICLNYLYKDKYVHYRSFEFCLKSIVISDTIISNHRGYVKSNIHLMPHIKLFKKSDNLFNLNNNSINFDIDFGDLKSTIKLTKSNFYKNFFEKKNNIKLVRIFNQVKNVSFKTKIILK